MQGVPRLLFHGLAEGLILAAVEREPASARALRDRLGRQLSQTPPREAVEPLLDQLAESDRIRAKPDGTDGAPTYHLTQEGARRLAAYRRLPGALAEGFEHLVGAADARNAHAKPDGANASRDPPAAEDLGPSAWVPAALERLPDHAPIEAPHAEVRLDRDTASGRWLLEVRGHAPESCEDEAVCPLTFLYRATVALLYRGDTGRCAQADAGAATADPPRRAGRP